MTLEQKIIADIGFFYFKKCHYNIVETNKAIDLLGICSIRIKCNIVYITLQRPGLLIGKGRKNYADLTEYLKKEHDIKRIELKEQKNLSWLYDYQYSNYELF